MIKNGAAIIAATDFKYSHPKILFGNFLMNEISGSSLQEEKKIMASLVFVTLKSGTRYFTLTLKK